MGKQEIENRLKTIVSDYASISADDITDDMQLTADMGIDSFGLIQMVGNIEQEFSIRIPDEVLMSFNSLDDVVNYIEKAI